VLGSVHGLTAGRSPPGVQPPSGGVGHQEQVGARLRWPSARQPHLSGIPAAGWLSPVGLATHNSPPDGVLRVRGLAGLGQRSSPPQAPARLASRLIKGYIYVAGLPTISASLPMRAGVVVCPADAVADRLHALRFDLASTEVSIRKALAKGDRGILKIASEFGVGSGKAHQRRRAQCARLPTRLGLLAQADVSVALEPPPRGPPSGALSVAPELPVAGQLAVGGSRWPIAPNRLAGVPRLAALTPSAGRAPSRSKRHSGWDALPEAFGSP